MFEISCDFRLVGGFKDRGGDVSLNSNYEDVPHCCSYLDFVLVQGLT